MPGRNKINKHFNMTLTDFLSWMHFYRLTFINSYNWSREYTRMIYWLYDNTDWKFSNCSMSVGNIDTAAGIKLYGSYS